MNDYEDEIVVDMDLWLAWLESLHYAYPKHYAHPDVALKGFFEDWKYYKEHIDTVKKGKRS
jgi:hypothetical protein